MLVNSGEGVFIGLCDESFVIATHDRIASSFQQAYLGPWLLSGYSLGYLASLPIVCTFFISVHTDTKEI